MNKQINKQEKKVEETLSWLCTLLVRTFHPEQK